MPMTIQMAMYDDTDMMRQDETRRYGLGSMLDSGVYCSAARLALDLDLDLILGLHYKRILRGQHLLALGACSFIPLTQDCFVVGALAFVVCMDWIGMDSHFLSLLTYT